MNAPSIRIRTARALAEVGSHGRLFCDACASVEPPPHFAEFLCQAVNRYGDSLGPAFGTCAQNLAEVCRLLERDPLTDRVIFARHLAARPVAT